MQKTRIAGLVLIVLALTARGAWATHGSVNVGTGQSGPINTVSASTVPGGFLGLDFQVEHTTFDTFSEAQLLAFAASGERVHNVDSITNYFLGFTYGMSDDLTLHLRLPYSVKNNIRESEPPDEIHNHGDAEGVGDLEIHFHYRFLRSASAGLEAAVFAGLKLPTGKTGVKDDSGTLLDAEFQPGSGSWDPRLGIAATKRIGPVFLDASLLYDLITEGTQSTDLGDIFIYNLALSYPAVRGPVGWDLIIEANGTWRQKEEISGKTDPNSGGSIICLSPGTRLSFGKDLSAYLTVGIPLFQDMNGNQNEVHYRLASGLVLKF